MNLRSKNDVRYYMNMFTFQIKIYAKDCRKMKS
nr:MAG TPA: hypothetical protein [Caudoviricetes sp.]